MYASAGGTSNSYYRSRRHLLRFACIEVHILHARFGARHQNGFDIFVWQVRFGPEDDGEISVVVGGAAFVVWAEAEECQRLCQRMPSLGVDDFQFLFVIFDERLDDRLIARADMDV